MLEETDPASGIFPYLCDVAMFSQRGFRFVTDVATANGHCPTLITGVAEYLL